MAAKKKAARRPAKKAMRKPARKAAPKKVSAIPKGYTSVTPGLVFKDARPALEWYGTVFGAKVTTRMDMPDGRIMHAEVKIGDALIMLGDEAPKMGMPSAETLGGSSGALMLYVKDCDAVYARAIAGGARPLMPLADISPPARMNQASVAHSAGSPNSRRSSAPSTISAAAHRR